MAYCTAIVTAALVLPLSVIVIWLLRGLHRGETFLPVWDAALNSVKAAGLAAIVATMAALPVAYFAVRYPSRVSAVTERAAYIGHGLPGIVIALSLVFFAANYALPLYQTLPLLIIAYVVLFLPQVQGALRANLLQINPRLEEAGRSLGHSSAQVLRRVTLPLLRPGLAAGAALVFLTAMKELPATLLLAPTGFRTLATQVWSAADEAFFARAAVPALLLVGISSLSLLFILSQEKRGAM